MTLNLLTIFFAVFTVYSFALMHEPFALWMDPCPPTGFYDDGSECVPGLAALLFIPIALLGLLTTLGFQTARRLEVRRMRRNSTQLSSISGEKK